MLTKPNEKLVLAGELLLEVSWFCFDEDSPSLKLKGFFTISKSEGGGGGGGGGSLGRGGGTAGVVPVGGGGGGGGGTAWNVSLGSIGLKPPVFFEPSEVVWNETENAWKAFVGSCLKPRW